MGKLSPRGSQYSDEDRRRAVATWLVTGSDVQTAKHTGIPASTIQCWRAKSEWWVALVGEVQDEHQAELDASYTRIIRRTQEAIEDRLDNGDTVMYRDGETAQKPIAAKDLAVIGAIQFDKRQLLRSMPTSIERSETSARLAELAEQFARIARQVDARVVSEQEPEESPSPPRGIDVTVVECTHERG